MPVFAAAFALGFIAGSRTFTAPAVLWLMRHRGPMACLLTGLALFEYAGDLSPKAPARTQAVGLTARAISGAFCGWGIAFPKRGRVVASVTQGALAAIAGAHASLAARKRAIAGIGRVPAALVEDGVSIAGALLIVSFA